MKIVHCQNESTDMSLHSGMLKGDKIGFNLEVFPPVGMGVEGAEMFGETDQIRNAPSESDHSVPSLLKWEKYRETE